MAAVVADASPLIALQQLGLLSLLEWLFGRVEIPAAVAREVAPSVPELPAWIRVRTLAQPIAAEILRASLGAGESEALGLALEVEAALLIVDDRPARRLAAGLGLPVAGTAGILMRAKQAGLVPAVCPLLDQLIQLGFRLAPAIRASVLAEVGELE
jgi:hypothetical protein